MNVNTGEIKALHDLSEDEINDDFWQRVPSHLNDKANKVKKNNGFVNLNGKSKLAKFAKNKREKPKGIVSKVRFRDLKKRLKNA